MKYLFIGLGSVGQRHIRNLRTIQPTAKIISFRGTDKDVRAFEKKYQVAAFTSFEQALDQKPDAAFITNPTGLHITSAIECAQRKLDIFIEKPISDSNVGMVKLEKLIKKNRLICMVGFMMRKSPGLKKIKDLLDTNCIGSLLSVSIINGEHIADWHTNEDYKTSYSARKSLGGGVILTFSHETDYATWLFGLPKTIYCTSVRVRSLNTDVEDSADILITTNTTLPVHIHLDHVSRPPVRRMSIIGDKGRIEWNYYAKKVTCYTADTEKPQEYTYDSDRNAMFISELKEFIQCIKTRKQPSVNFLTGKKNLRIILAAKRSARVRKVIKI